MRSLAILLALSCLAPATAQDFACTSLSDCSFRSRPNGEACTTVACWEQTFQAEPSSYATYYSAAMREHGRGRTALADSLLARAIGGPPTDVQRARFFAALAVKGYGPTAQHLAACLGYDPLNGNCLFIQAGLDGDAARAAAGDTVAGRAGYWCMAERYENVAAASEGQIASTARRALAQYARAAPSARESLAQG